MVSDTLESMTRMFHEACADLGAINEALGLNPDDGGAEPILMAIEALKLRAKYAETGTPVAYFVNGAAEGHPPLFEQITDDCKDEPDVFPLYAAAPQRDRNDGLTDAEIDTIAESMPGGLDGFLKGWGWRNFARAVEAEVLAALAAPVATEGFAIVPKEMTTEMLSAWFDTESAQPFADGGLTYFAPRYRAMISAAPPVSPDVSQSDAALTRELLETLQSTVRYFTKTPSTLADSQARGKAHEVIAKAYAQLGYTAPASDDAADACETCSGHGQVGGFVNAESGYQSDPCPDCTRVDAESDEPRYRVMKASGSRYAYVIDTVNGGSKGRYDVLKSDGWANADKHAATLNKATEGAKNET